MLFKLDTFHEQIQPFRKTNDKGDSDRGFAKALDYVINLYPTKEVDFDSFSLDDAYRAFDAVTEIVPMYAEEDEDETFTLSSKHPYAVIHTMQCAITKLYQVEKSYELEDDFI